MYSPISFILLTVTVSVIKITVAQRLLNLADQDKYFPDWKKLEIATDEQKSEWLSQWVEDIAERCEQNGVDVFVALEIVSHSTILLKLTKSNGMKMQE